jgi:hypothetical protein
MRNLCIEKGQGGLRVDGCLVHDCTPSSTQFTGGSRGASRAEDLEEAERERYYGVNRQQNL